MGPNCSCRESTLPHSSVEDRVVLSIDRAERTASAGSQSVAAWQRWIGRDFEPVGVGLESRGIWVASGEFSRSWVVASLNTRLSKISLRWGRVEEQRGCPRVPFQLPAHRTGRADFQHPAFRQTSHRAHTGINRVQDDTHPTAQRTSPGETGVHRQIASRCDGGAENAAPAFPHNGSQCD